MNESFLPLIGEKQTKFEHEIDKMEVKMVVIITSQIKPDNSKLSWLLESLELRFISQFQRSLENMSSFHEMMIKSLFKFVQGAAHLWDLHEIGLARQERKLQVQFYATVL